jgi:fatty-acyl-CoA synthase
MDDPKFRPIQSISDVRFNETIPLIERNLPTNTYNIFKNSASHYVDKVALRFLFQGTENKARAISYSYGDLLKYITQTSLALQNLGVGKEDAVTILLPNLPQYHFSLWGAAAVGIASPVNPLLEPSHIVSIMNQTKAKVLITLAPFPHTNLWMKAQEIVPFVPSLKIILTIDMRQFLLKEYCPPVEKIPHKINHITIYDFDSYLDRFASHCSSFQCEKNWDDTASFFHTGGTTGLPKIAKQSHGNQVFSAWMVGKQVNWSDKEVIHCGLPMFHVNAPLISGLAPLMVGAEIVMTSPQGFRNEGVLDHFADLIKEYNISFFMCVPTIFIELSNRWKDREDIHLLKSLRFVACGAAPLPPAVMERFKKITKKLPQLKILEGYGLTEGTVFSTVTPPFSSHDIKHSIGIRIPYQQMEVVTLDENNKVALDEQGNIAYLGPHETGVIIIRGPNVFQGYLNEKDNDNAWIDKPGGWLNTGDLAKKNKEEYFFLAGRKKDLIIRGGHNIDPRLIEEALNQHPDVAMVAAIGKPNKRLGEVPIAYVQLYPDRTTSKNDLLAYAKQHISEQAAIPCQIEIIKEMPLTSVGKIYKPILRKRINKQVIEEELAEFIRINHILDINVLSNASEELTTYILIKDDVSKAIIKEMQKQLQSLPMQIEWQRCDSHVDLSNLRDCDRKTKETTFA